MADNVAITAGSGTTIGTDDVSGVHIQKVKLVDGTADSSTAIPGDANGLYVQFSAGASTKNCSSSDGSTALTNSAQSVKGSAGAVWGYYIYNPATVNTAYAVFYDVASASVTVGTTNPLFVLAIPALSAANLWMPGGVAFSTAISVAAASTAAGNGAPGSALEAIIWYK